MQPFPNQVQIFVDKLGRILNPWTRYLQQFTQAPPNIMAITVDVSPFTYTAAEPGFIIVLGGTVSAIHLVRGAIDINLTGQKIIPVSIKDEVIITYSVLPTVQFIPIYGAAASP